MKITIKGKGYKQYVKGDYVLTPCPNAFNNKVSYWISKKHVMYAMYCFTPLDEKDTEYHVSHFDTYILAYERYLDMCTRRS
ncbi:MAG: hypothetical protein IJT36_01745 [Alphaproteobacteria bacterium]|nr:hypothetical protein [Alphaproteobacteria bacterium]